MHFIKFDTWKKFKFWLFLWVVLHANYTPRTVNQAAHVTALSCPLTLDSFEVRLEEVLLWFQQTIQGDSNCFLF